MNYITKNISIVFSMLLLTITLSGCASLLVGGAATVGVATVQERTLKDAAKDLEIKLFIEDQLFITDTEKLFARVSVTVIEQRVMLVGNVASNKIKDKAAEIAWNAPGVFEVLNEILIKEDFSLIESAKDARISVTLSGLLITDASISDINYYHSVSDQIIYVIGIAQDKEELKRVLLHSRTIKGVKKVISHVILKTDKKRSVDNN